MTDKTTVEGTTGWTVETLKEWIDQRFTDNQTAIGAALLATKEGAIKTEIATEKRFDAVNKSVTELTDRTRDLLPRTEYAANHKALDDKIDVVTRSIDKSDGDKNLYATHADVAAAVDGIQNTIRPLVEYVTRQQGQATGSQITMGKITALLGIFTAVLGIMVYFVSQIAK